MVSLTTFLGSLPPASLATADLPRFLTRVMGRRARSELAPLAALLEAQTLSGYPASLAPVLRLVVGEIQESGVEPDALDPEGFERLLASRAFLEKLERDVGLERQPLRPGVPVSTTVRSLTEGHLRVLPGHGPQLVLVAPVAALSVRGLGWWTLRGPALARPMDVDEAEALATAWAVVEECFGWQTPASLPWEARLVRVSTRPNHDAARCRDTLRAMNVPTRRALWDAMVEHLRDDELDDAHRPGLAGLRQRLQAADVALLGAPLEELLALAQSAYEACREDPAVAEGFCPCTKGDLALYDGFVEVPEASRERLRGSDPATIEHHLRLLAEIEARGLDVALDEDLRRDLRGFRDRVLKRRYRRDAAGLAGVDPLQLAQARCAAGFDRTAIVAELAAIATEARAASRTEPHQPAAAGRVDASVASKEPGAQAAAGAEAAVGRERRPPGGEATQGIEAPTAFPRDAAVERARALPETPPEPAEQPEKVALPAISPPAATDHRPRAPDTRTPTGDLPPLPKPPAWTRPVTGGRIELPPMPPSPKLRRKRKSAPEATGRGEAGPGPRKIPEREPLPDLSKAPPPRRRRPTTSRLVTPRQAHEFYETAFKELEVLERDLLERGPWPAAAERMHALNKECKDLELATAPAARSGDKDFSAALQKIRLVRSYLDRVMPLLDGPPPTVDMPPEPEDEPKRGLFSFRRRKRDD